MLNNNLDVHIIIKKIKYISYVNINTLDAIILRNLWFQLIFDLIYYKHIFG